jgi:orotidine-5'-phosphate decarboxylase
MSDKLILALDVPDFESAKKLVKDLGNDVRFYKIGLELMASGDYFRIIEFLKNNDKKIFADLKLYDISQTIARSVKNLAKFEIDLLTIHSASRDIMLKASENKGSMKIVAVTVLTNLDQNDLQEMGFDQAKSLEDLVLQKTKMALESNLDGVVASAQEAQNLRNKFGQDFLIVTPGIRLEKILNDDQKRVVDVKTALANGASHLVVGRPITQSENPYLMAQKFIKLINEFKPNS